MFTFYLFPQIAMEAKHGRVNVQSRGWCFTINNYTEADGIAVDSLKCDYLICGREKGAQGTEHMQCYCYFSKRKSFAAVRALLGGRAHIEPAKGTPAQNRAYCSKDGDFIERGVLPKPGKRTDLMDMRDMLKAGKSMKEVAMECRSYQALRGAELLRKYIRPPIEENAQQKPVVVWFWGPTGTGKSRAAFRRARRYGYADDYWVSNNSLQWYDGYAGESCVILDDIRRDHVDFSWLLRLLDGYPGLMAPVKGAFTLWTPKHVIITAPIPPEDFAPCTENSQQLVRRIDKIKHFE